MGAPPHTTCPIFLPVKRGSIARAHPPPTRALSVSLKMVFSLEGKRVGGRVRVYRRRRGK